MLNRNENHPSSLKKNNAIKLSQKKTNYRVIDEHQQKTLVESKEILTNGDVMYRRVNQVAINLELIPDYIRDALAATVLECVEDCLRQPEGRKMLEERIEA